VKQMGARNAGNPHVACDVEGAGDVVWVGTPGPHRRASPRPYREEHPPCSLEFAACFVEGLGRAARAFPRVAAGIKTAGLAPRVLVMRAAGADRDSKTIAAAIATISEG